MIPSPARDKQTKTTQQQIHNNLKKVHVSRFPVVSNEAIQELSSVTVNETVNSKERTSSKAGASPAILKISKQTVPQELDKVLSIKFYAEVTKRNGDTNVLETLKIMQSAIQRYLKEKTIHWACSNLRVSVPTPRGKTGGSERLRRAGTNRVMSRYSNLCNLCK